jgi:peptidoglycan glycosyltransferase
LRPNDPSGLVTGYVYRLALFFVVGFLVLSGALVYWQIIRAIDVGQSPSNPRTVLAAQQVVRGTIVDRHGALLAQSDPAHPGVRRYTQDSLSNVIGYDSIRYGRADLEASFNSYLDGNVGVLPGMAALEAFLHLPRRGDNLTLTIDLGLQQLADQALGNRKGVVLVLQPATGAVLALVSKPYFDPNTVDQNWQALSTDADRVLLNRATQAVYPPGSIFKLVTASAALEIGAVTPTTPFTCIGDWVVEGFHISCENPQIPSQLDFQRAMELSANAIFAQVAYHLGAPTLTAYADKFGFGMAPPIGLLVTPSRLKDPATPWSGALLASTGFGQGQLEVTPLQLALVVEAIANHGTIMEPYFVTRATTPNGVVVYQHETQPWRQAIQAGTAATLTNLLVGVVDNGSGDGARIPGVKVAGKTGTAQVGGTQQPHAVFVTFAPADHPTVEVVVLVENGGEGATVAAPIARTMMEAALKSPAQ